MTSFELPGVRPWKSRRQAGGEQVTGAVDGDDQLRLGRVVV